MTLSEKLEDLIERHPFAWGAVMGTAAGVALTILIIPYYIPAIERALTPHARHVLAGVLPALNLPHPAGGAALIVDALALGVVGLLLAALVAIAAWLIRSMRCRLQEARALDDLGPWADD